MMNWLDTLVFEQMMDDDWEAARTTADIITPPPGRPLRTPLPGGHIPGRLEYLASIRFNGTTTTTTLLRPYMSKKGGYLYDIFRGSKLVDIGSTTRGPTSRVDKNLQGRISEKRSRTFNDATGIDTVDLFYVELGKRWYERRFVTIHELWRQYLLRREMSGIYDPSRHEAEDFDEVPIFPRSWM